MVRHLTFKQVILTLTLSTIAIATAHASASSKKVTAKDLKLILTQLKLIEKQVHSPIVNSSLSLASKLLAGVDSREEFEPFSGVDSREEFEPLAGVDSREEFEPLAGVDSREEFKPLAGVDSREEFKPLAGVDSRKPLIHALISNSISELMVESEDQGKFLETSSDTFITEIHTEIKIPTLTLTNEGLSREFRFTPL
ncbi:MAG: hypothetical protein R3A80_11985 [Bdellovibrionota bacterium]